MRAGATLHHPFLNMRDLDHRGKAGTSLREQGLATFALKKDAISFAKQSGWLVKDVTRASNRFCIFWVVCQVYPETVKYLTKDASIVEAPWPGLY
jgi:hypothetical protein